ncbi:hypothetical protein SDC9_210920 [bioreactor metagenome]|uniref:Uncharacterized protein n=1 Tax=bioreactor metagenome TaxID=1076179 RepID=A0A645JHJ9_9ZZZZ
MNHAQSDALDRNQLGNGPDHDGDDQTDQKRPEQWHDILGQEKGNQANDK